MHKTVTIFLCFQNSFQISRYRMFQNRNIVIKPLYIQLYDYKTSPFRKWKKESKGWMRTYILMGWLHYPLWNPKQVWVVSVWNSEFLSEVWGNLITKIALNLKSSDRMLKQKPRIPKLYDTILNIWHWVMVSRRMELVAVTLA